jgi:peptide/nickel transport system substrate-binding protein
MFALAPIVLGALAFAQGARAAPVPGEIVIVVPTEPNTLEPCETSNEAPGRIVRENVNETLVDISPDNGAIVPRLATSWKQIDDRTWRFTLVKNAKFDDGEPFNADALVFNVSRSFNKTLGCSQINKAFAGFQLTAKKVDDYTVDVTANKPAPIMVTGFGVLTLVSPKTPIDKPVRTASGTGPYKFVEWVPGQRVVLERRDDYWGPKPDVKKVTFVFRTDDAVRAAMVATGEADIAMAISDQDANNPKTDFSYLNSETTHIRIDERYPPLDDVRVRKALNYAVDRSAMLGTVLSKTAIPASQIPVPGIFGHNDSIKPYPYDPEKAKALLAEAKAAGVPVDAKIRFIGRSAQWAQVDEFAQALNAMFQAVGFNTELEMMERARETSFQVKPFPENVGPNLILESSDNNLGDASFSVFSNYHSQGSQSTSNFPELDKAIDAANSATGEDRRKDFEEIFRKVQEDLVPSIILFHMVGVTRVSERLDWKPTITTNSQIDVQKIKFRTP